MRNPAKASDILAAGGDPALAFQCFTSGFLAKPLKTGCRLLALRMRRLRLLGRMLRDAFRRLRFVRRRLARRRRRCGRAGLQALRIVGNAHHAASGGRLRHDKGRRHEIVDVRSRRSRPARPPCAYHAKRTCRPRRHKRRRYQWRLFALTIVRGMLVKNCPKTSGAF